MGTWKWLLTGGAVPPLLLFCGAFFLFYLRGQPFRNPREMWRALTAAPKSDGVSPFRALTLALAGTLGVGNIVGVANALRVGGAGAIFWMWVSALFAMILKYAEIALAVRHRREKRGGGFFGGAYYYIRDHFDEKRRFRAGAALAAAFAGFMALNALSMGCVVQVNAVSSALRGVASIPPGVTGVLLLLLVLPVILRGSGGVSTLTEWLVPIMSGGYLVLSVAALILRRGEIGGAFAAIFRDAFRPRSAAGGALGFLTSSALRTGTMRGLLSNEAGCGTAPTAHASADTDSPAGQGVWGIVEVFVDTVVLCTATALVLLVSGIDTSASDGVMTAIRAYSATLGGWSEWFFAAAIFCFGYATVICWANYGAENVAALSPKKRYRIFYYLLVAGAIAAGVSAVSDVVWDVADFALAVLTTVNLVMLMLTRREIREETEKRFGKKMTKT